ncbi:MAG: hypothetical protein M1822_003882 [Bathelium mastoideum]|nr:MAG: hypothetical protein M1822_003882 [Bathelium mastoideum]
MATLPENYVPTYHQTTAPYLLPNDRELNSLSAPEQARLQYQAEALIDLVGGRIVISEIDFPPHARIVDIGCGTGSVALGLARKYPSAQVFGVDISLRTLQRDVEWPSNIEFVEGDIFDLVGRDERFRPESFDFVCHRLFLFAMAKWPEYMTIVASLLKPGAACELGDYVHRYYNSHDEPMGENWKSLQTFRAVAKRKGFDLDCGTTIADYARNVGLTDIEQYHYKITASRWMVDTNPETFRMGYNNELTESPFHRNVMKRMLQDTEYSDDDIKEFQDEFVHKLDTTRHERKVDAKGKTHTSKTTRTGTSSTMPKPRRNVELVAEETLHPPENLSTKQSIARVVKAAGKNLYSVQLPSQKTLLVELPSRFRSTIWIKRGGYVLVDTAALAERENKLDGEVVNIVGDEKAWRKMGYWPKEFAKNATLEVESDEDDSHVGKMPPDGEEEEG